MSKNQQVADKPSCNAVSSVEAQAFETVAIEHIKAAGHRVTGPRIWVVRALSRTNCALSAYEIHDSIREAGGKADVVTVYRVLQTLMETGLVHRIGVLDGYYACRSGGNHGEDTEHLVCKTCGCVQELTVTKSSSQKLSSHASAAGFRPEAIRVEVLGTCAHCTPSS